MAADTTIDLTDIEIRRQPEAASVGGETVYSFEDGPAYRTFCERAFTKGYNFPNCLTGLDMGYGLRSVLNLRNLEDFSEITIWMDVPYDAPKVPSVTDIWGGVEWHEREAYDLVGIIYTGHPDLRRILLEDHWSIHPLQRRYDTGGYLIPSWKAQEWPNWEEMARLKEEEAIAAEEAKVKRAEEAKAKAAAAKAAKEAEAATKEAPTKEGDA